MSIETFQNPAAEKNQDNFMKKNIIGVKDPFGKVKRIIVGIVEGAMIPELHISVKATMPKKQLGFFKKNGGKRFPRKYIRKAKKELNNLTKLLENQGIKVDRPEKRNFSKSICTPNWETKSGLYAAMPRDILLVIGRTIIVAPMSWRCRYREIEAYEKLLKEYNNLGYEIIFPPKPRLHDGLYKKDFGFSKGKFTSVLEELEPVFDAADFLVLGKEILAQESHATNKAGIRWLRNVIGKDCRITVLKTKDDKPMHIDATILPLNDKYWLINPERIDPTKLRLQLPRKLKKIKFLKAPKPVVLKNDPPKYMSSDWLSMNIITLNSSTAVVEESQEPLIKLLKKIKFEVIAIPFKNFQCFGGSFHCATLEIIRE